MTLSSVISHFELSLNSSKGHGRNLLGELVVVDETWGGGWSGKAESEYQAWF